MSGTLVKIGACAVFLAIATPVMEEIRRRSTVPLPEAGPDRLTGSTNLIGEVVFDWEIADTGTRFERCRYYFIVHEQRGEDPRTAGKWILAASLGERGTSSSYAGLEFTPAPPR